MMSYLDIDQILAEEERFPCKFLVEAPTLGQLDPTNAGYGNPLPIGSRVELPLWLAESLQTRKMVEIEIPKHFGPKMRDELASLSNVNLKEFSHYFFDVGLKFGKLTKDDDLLRALRTAFCERYKSLTTHSLTNYHDDIAEYSQSLTSTELIILNEGLKVSKDMQRWRNREGNTLTAAPILSKRILTTDKDGTAKRSRLT